MSRRMPTISIIPPMNPFATVQRCLRTVIQTRCPNIFMRIMSRRIYWIPFIALTAIFLMVVCFQSSGNSGRLTGRNVIPKMRYVINPGPCEKESKLAVFVLSEPAAHHKRDMVRKTWASYPKTGVWPAFDGVSKNVHMEVFFILGYYKNETLKNQFKVFQESETHRDIIQANFIDSLENEAKKILLVYLWTSEQCQGVNFTLIITDNSFPNLPAISQYLGLKPIKDDEILVNKAEGISPNNRIVQLRKMPFYVKRDGLILTPRLATALYRSSKNVKQLPKANFFSMGILPDVLGQTKRTTVKLLDGGEKFQKYTDLAKDDKLCLLIQNDVFFMTGMTPGTLLKFWTDLKNPKIRKICK